MGTHRKVTSLRKGWKVREEIGGEYRWLTVQSVLTLRYASGYSETRVFYEEPYVSRYDSLDRVNSLTLSDQRIEEKRAAARLKREAAS